MTESFDLRGRADASSPGDRTPDSSSGRRARETETYVIFQTTRKTLALKVTQVLGQSQVVLKPLQGQLRSNNGIAGATILGDGRVALVIDVEEVPIEGGDLLPGDSASFPLTV